MRRLDFPPMHLDLPIFPNERLRQVKRIVVVFGVPQHHRNVVGSGGRINRVHLWAVSFQGMLHVFPNHFEFDRTLPTLNSA